MAFLLHLIDNGSDSRHMTCTRSSQSKSQQGWEGNHKVLLLLKEVLATGRFWGMEESVFFKDMGPDRLPML